MDNKFVTMFAESLKSAHETLEGTMHGVDDKVLHFMPEGKAIPISAAYAHVVISEDIMLGGWVMKEKPFIEGEMADKAGLSSPQPVMDEKWEKSFPEWYKTLKMDLTKFQEYAKAVYKRSEDYVSSLKDSDLYEKKVDLSIWGLGEWELGKFLLGMIISHINNLTGEISAAKGLQGLKGYPF